MNISLRHAAENGRNLEFRPNNGRLIRRKEISDERRRRGLMQ